MPSEFVNHFTRSLDSPTSRTVSPLPSPSPSFRPLSHGEESDHGASSSQRKERLHALLVSLNEEGSIGPDEVQRYTGSLEEILYPSRVFGYTEEISTGDLVDPEERALEEAVVGKLTVALYSDALNTYLNQATEVEAEAEWWADIESSRTSVALYLLQTLPARIVNAVKAILRLLQANQIPVTLSSLSPSSVRALLPSRFSLRPGLITTALFPHLNNEPSLSLAVLLPPSGAAYTSSSTSTSILSTLQRVRSSASFALRFANLPMELTRQECRYNRKALEHIRDERAEDIGELAQLRAPLGRLLHRSVNSPTMTIATKGYTSILDRLSQVISSDSGTSSSPLIPLNNLSQNLLVLRAAHTQLLYTRHLLRPPVLTRLWPSLLVFPPLALYIYTSRTSWIPVLIDMAADARETARGFVEGWLVEPLVGVIKTVRAGGKGEVLVREEGVMADLESLQRMTLDLARDALHYTPSQLARLAEQVRVGDLTPVMQIYEQDIRTPLRSVLSGTLLRNAFIQVQKAKVDIDQALSGIDRLLKSQELTFAFVGVAPALAIVYAVFGSLSRLWGVSKSSGMGGRKRRRGVWDGMRRIERLLIMYPESSSESTTEGSAPIAPLPTGLLILSLTRLRSYALACLPPSIQAPFLQDLGDLEDTKLGRDAKLRIVERMWRCWGVGGQAVIRF